jgi:glycosyltransferase involved in cell wall biosynthesis
VGPFTVKKASRRVESIIQKLSPDLVHALRIPFEGMVAANAEISAPLIISVWGNDFTLHAGSSPGMKRLTGKAMARADGLHTDCQRDVRLAAEWGYRGVASIVLPGGGGIKRDIFHPGRHIPEGIDGGLAELINKIPYDAPVVINPRGFRAYVRNDIFFKSIPLVLREVPEVFFLCVGMRDESEAHAWVRRLQIESNVRLLPRMRSRGMAAGFRRAWISVSPSEHDGTPNTFLEAIACGCFPIVGDIESMREWINPGENGLLVDPGNPQAWAQAIVRAIRDNDLRSTAKDMNEGLINEKAEYGFVQTKAREFYRRVLDQYDPGLRVDHV